MSKRQPADIVLFEDLMLAGIDARVMPKFQEKTSVKTKVFELLTFDVGSQKKEAA
jgi:hypothetical protein